jgi:hypothetical protein
MKGNKSVAHFCIAFLCLLPLTNVFAQVSANYTASQVAAPAYTDLSAAKTVLIGGTWNDNPAANLDFTAIGFNFKFNGATQTSCWVSPNGFITFGSAPTTTNYTPIASAETYTGAIAGFAANLSVATTVAGTPQPNSVSYELTGTPGSQILKLDWRAFKRTPDPSGEARLMRMQIWLYEGTDVIEVHIAPVGSAALTFTTQVYAQVGLRGSTNSDWNLFSHTLTGAWPTGAAFATNQVAPAGSNAGTMRSQNGFFLDAAAYRLFRFVPNNCSSPTALSVSNVLINTADINLTEPTPSPTNGYQYEIRTAGTPGTALGPLDVAGTDTGTTLGVSGLTAGTTYTAYVRSDCGGSSYSAWVSAGTFTTLCASTTVPYYQDFNATVIPNLPTCTTRQNIGTGNLWTSGLDFDSGFFDNHLVYLQSGTQQANVWFYTQGIQLTAGTTYDLSYLYGGSSVPATITNRIEVKYGLAPTNLGMTIPLDNHPNIKGSPTGNKVIFTAPSTDVYYFGFRAYSLQAQGSIYLDDISIVESTCVPPTGLAVDGPSIASTSATILWTAPTPAPGSGYAYYVTPTNPVVTMGTGVLVAGQTYTISSVGTFDFTTVGAPSNTVGQTFVAIAPAVNAGSFIIGQTYIINTIGTTNFTTIGAPINSIGVQFVATGVGTGTGNATTLQIPTSGTGSATIVLGNNISPSGTTGAGITLANLTGLANNTTYYVWVRSRCSIGINSGWTPTYISFTTLNVPPYCIPSSASSTTFINNFATTNGITNISNISGFALPSGYIDYTTTSQVVTQAPGASINFTLGMTTPINAGVAIWVDWNNNGTFEVGERMYNSAAYVTTASGTFTVPGGTPTGFVYRMRVMVDYWATSPSPCVINTLFGGQQGEVEDYNFRVVPPPPALTLSSNVSAQCANTPSALVTLTAGGPPTYNTYTWSPATGVSGSAAAGWTFTNTTTTVYTLTALQTSAPFSINTVRYTYQATPAPTAVAVTPIDPAVCQTGPAQLLTASGGTVFNSIALSESFESGAPTWTRNNLSVGGSIANAAWTDRNNGYNISGYTFQSNDSSTFIMSDSDEQGIGSTTSTNLVSPVFSLQNYTDANLVFYHHYQGYINGAATVDISTNGGTTWLPSLQTYTTTSQGLPNNFALVTINLNAYVGQTNLRIRFNYNANWAWYWAIDNVTVQGTRIGQIVWNTVPPTVGTDFVTPIPGLFTNAAATIPYTLNTVSNTVYTLPTATTSYTSSTNVAGCSTSVTSNITLTPVVAGTVTGTQTNCNTASLSNLVLTGHAGSVVRWEYASNAAFTIGVTPIANTTTTLTPAEFGTFDNTRYFRAVVGNGSCNTINSNIVSVTIPTTVLTGTNIWSNGTPDITKRVVIDGTYTATANFSACSVVVRPGRTLTVQPGVTVTVQNEFVVEGAVPNTVIFQNNSSLIQLSDAVNVGAIRYERNTTPVVFHDYTYWSSPVANQVLGTFSPDTAANRFYIFNNVSYSWQTISTASVMNAAQGYIIRAPGTHSVTVPSVFTGAFYGVPHNGPYSINITVSGTQNRNLLGNPYPSAIDADLLYGANNTVLQGNMFFWTHNTPITANNYNSNDYAVYNASGGAGTAASINPGVNPSIPTGNIAAGQGFFVQGLASGTVNFTNAIRLTGLNSLFYRSPDAPVTNVIEKHRIWLNIINQQGAYKQMLLGYIEGATNAIDNAYDAEVTEAGNVVSLYSLNTDKKLTIQGRALPFEVNDEVPLGFRTSIAGNYAIELENFDGLFEEGQTIYLEDKLLNVIHNLNESNYNFTTESGTFDDRFEVQFQDDTLGVENPTDASNAVIVYKNNQTIFINSSNLEMSEVKLFDIRGRLITMKKDILASEVSFANLAVANQMILVQITTTDGSTVTKKVAY